MIPKCPKRHNIYVAEPAAMVRSPQMRQQLRAKHYGLARNSTSVAAYKLYESERSRPFVYAASVSQFRSPRRR